MHETAENSNERREPRADRRSRPTPMLSKYSLFGGRRAGERRDGVCMEGLYVDRYPASLFLLAMALFALNLLDAIYTLMQVSSGAVEMNPLARGLLGMGPHIFILTKTLVVGLVLVFICMHTNFRRARFVLGFGLGVYTLVAAYHVVSYSMLT